MTVPTAAFLARVMAAAQNDPRVVLAFSDSRTIHVDGSPQWESYKGYYGHGGGRGTHPHRGF